MDLTRLNPISWYPGHMRVAEREMQQKLGLIDVVVEVVDARAPASSRHHDFSQRFSHKARVLVLSKSDLAEALATQAWQRHYAAAGEACLAYNITQTDTATRLRKVLARVEAADRQRRGAQNPRLRPLRVMIAGLPNTGKSSLINLVLGSKRAAVGPRPGVTRHQQWVLVADNVELLDTPGVMMPKIAGVETGLRLGLIAALKDEHIGEELLANYLLHLWEQRGLDPATALYRLDPPPVGVVELLTGIARSTGLLRRGAEPDLRQAAVRLLGDFRLGRLGRLTLDPPPPEKRAAKAPAAAEAEDDGTGETGTVS